MLMLISGIKLIVGWLAVEADAGADAEAVAAADVGNIVNYLLASCRG